ncbi:MAG: PAS domain S-box protein [Bacteroidota bacterium]
MKPILRVLIVEDSEDDAELLLHQLSKSDYTIVHERVETQKDFIEALRKKWDIILSDFKMPHFSGTDALTLYKQHDLDIPFIIVSGTIGEEIAVETMKAGAHDYIMKGNLKRLLPAIQRELRESHNRAERKLADVQLSQAKEEWERTFDAITDPIIVLDTKFQILKANKAMSAVFDMEPKGLLGLRCYEAVHGKHTPPEQCPHARMLKDGCPHSVEIYEQKLGGNYVVSVSPLRTPEGVLYGSIHIARNITDRKEMELALRDSEQKYRKIFENVQDVFFQTNLEGIITEISPSIERYSDYPRIALIGTPIAQLYRNPGNHEELLKMIKNHGEIVDYELPLKGKNGRVIYASVNAHILIDSTGAIAGYEGAIRDISERKRSEREMIMLSQAIKSVSECVSVTDALNNILFVNAAFLQTYGYTKEELIGKNISVVRSDKNAPDLVSDILTTTLRGNWEGEVINKRKDGTEFLVHLSTTNVRDDHNDIIALIGVAKDITEQRKAEAALRESEERHRLILHTALDGFWFIDMEGRFLEVNETYCKMSGYQPDELLTLRLSDLGPSEAVKNMTERFAELIGKGEDRFESQLCRKDGSVFIIEVSAQYLPIENGRIVAFLRDITEKKQLEAQFLRAQRMEGLGTLAGGIAHDLNNVLSPILLSVEFLKRNFVSESAQKILESVETSARRGSEIVKQILAFARGMETQKILLQPRHLIKEIVGIFKETFSRSISIVSDIPNNTWTIVGDPTHFHQLIMNLGVNARDAMPDGGTLTITASNVEIDELYARMNIDARTGRYVLISIQDSGIGMSPKTLDHIFEPFFTTKEIGKGTGLGMSTVYSIVKSHNGFINVQSEIGKGTTVNIYLPASDVSPMEKHEPMAHRNFNGNGELVLVVDDEASIREVTKQTLESYNYTVVTASDGAEGVVRFTENRDAICLVVTDIMMPVLDGKHMIASLRKINPKIKVIASSGLIDKTMTNIDEKIPVDAFIDKPYTAEKLMELVTAVLRNNSHTV